MNKRLIIYDKAGTILAMYEGNYTLPQGVDFIEIDFPEGASILGVDPMTKEPIWYVKPETGLDRVEAKLAEVVSSLSTTDATVASHGEDILNNELALTEIYEMLLEVIG
ncbi:MAG: hypothetical protein MJZ16_13770 [Bacteroidales bacterium]|nr:hypothetical protein [Bacteroidales bacterium]